MVRDVQQIKVIDFEQHDPREYWATGFHQFIDGTVVRIARMSDEMLRAMVQFYDGQFDTAVFIKEIKKRKA